MPIPICNCKVNEIPIKDITIGHNHIFTQDKVEIEDYGTGISKSIVNCIPTDSNVSRNFHIIN